MKGFIQIVMGLFFIANLSYAETAADGSISIEREIRRDSFRGCTVELQTRRGDYLDSFTARTCQDARWDCEDELRQRRREGRNPYARCVVVSDDGGSDHDRGYWTCTARDRGWEEHAGGHQMTGYNLREVQNAALSECLRVHGECSVSCTQN
jgi:hypothetical protein